MTDADIEATKAPLMEHLIELRMRLVRSLVAFIVLFVIFFYFSKGIFNILVLPYGRIAGDSARLIYTAPQEFFFTQMKVAMFAAGFCALPVILSQIYAFVAPGLYKRERAGFAPYLIATPVFFALGGLLVYFVVLPNLLNFFIHTGEKQPGVTPIELLPRVSEYLSLIMTLIFAFGLVFQMPVILTLLGRIGIISSQFLIDKWRYAAIIITAVAGVLTPPDILSMMTLAVPGMLLYGLSILSVRFVEKQRGTEVAVHEDET